MASNNPLITAWRDGRRIYGLWLTTPGSVQAEIVARQGFDYVCVDYQHGLIDHSTGVPMMQGITAGGGTPIARAGWNDATRIMQVLDAGAVGVVVPMVNNAEEAAAAVAACKYPPVGMRSYGPVRARETFGSADPDALADVACIVMVETADGIRNVAEIAATPGVDAIYIGPSDLALAMGYKPNPVPPPADFLHVIEDIVKACRDAGIAAGIQAASGQIAKGYADQGFDMITVASDGAVLGAAARSHLETAKSGSVSAGHVANPTSNY
jgi:4-hydroxy-2-oxoheptanedioate aldolase